MATYRGVYTLLACVLIASISHAGIVLQENSATTISVGPCISDESIALSTVTVTSAIGHLFKSDGSHTQISITASAGNNDMAHVGGGVYSFELTAGNVDTTGSGLLIIDASTENVLTVYHSLEIVSATEWTRRFGTDNDPLNVNVVAVGGSGVNSPNDLKADVSNLDAAVSSRSTFNAASDQVIVQTNNDKTGYSISGTKQTLDVLNDLSTAQISSTVQPIVNTELIDVTPTINTINTNTDDLETRLTAARAGYLDKLNVSGTLAHSDAANTYKADVSNLDAAVSTRAAQSTVDTINTNTDDLETRLTALRAGYLDNLNVVGVLANTDNADSFKADITSLATSGVVVDASTSLGAKIDGIATGSGATYNQVFGLVAAASQEIMAASQDFGSGVASISEQDKTDISQAILSASPEWPSGSSPEAVAAVVNPFTVGRIAEATGYLQQQMDTIVNREVAEATPNLDVAISSRSSQTSVDTINTNTDDLETRLTALRAGYLDKLNVSGTLAHSDAANTYKADVSNLDAAVSTRATVDQLNQATATIIVEVDANEAAISGVDTKIDTVDGVVDSIRIDTNNTLPGLIAQASQDILAASDEFPSGSGGITFEQLNNEIDSVTTEIRSASGSVYDSLVAWIDTNKTTFGSGTAIVDATSEQNIAVAVSSAIALDIKNVSGALLATLVPGSYTTGTVGYTLGRIQTGQITTVSPVLPTGDVTIVSGDDYQGGRALTWTNSDGDWSDLTGATLTLNVGSLSVAGTVVSPTGTQQISFELTDTQTASLTSSRYQYYIRATLSNGNIETLTYGYFAVRRF